jgi:hypothetical protein
MGRAGQPLTDDPLSADCGSPGEVLAEDGATCTVGCRSARYRAVREVLAIHHVRGVAAGGSEKTNVQSQGGEMVARPDGVDRLEERGLRAVKRAGLCRGSRT